MPTVSCAHVVERASDYLDDALEPSDRRELSDHLDECANCPTYLSQLRTTIGLLGERPGVTVPDDLRQAVDDAMAGTAERDSAALAAREHSPRLLALARSFDENRADDLVQQTWLRAFDEGSSAFTRDRLSEILTDLATSETRTATSSLHDDSAPTAIPEPDPDADTGELFYPDFYAEGPDAGAWVQSPNAWPGDSRILSPEADADTGELVDTVDAAIDELSDFQAQVITLIDIEGLLADHVALSLDRSLQDVRRALHAARNHVRGRLDHYLTPAT